MSKKVQTKEIPSEDVPESSVSVRRSTRISSSLNAVGSPIVKTISTRRSSSSRAASKETNGDTDRNSPVVEKRKTRRTSTDSDINPTPIKTRRSSISKIVEEEKKLTSSPNTPTRKSTRSMSRSPSNISEVPARRTRRSSQDTETVVEQQPARRSLRRRPSADSQEEATKEEQPKPVTRRRRSSSADEPEASKIDTKAKTKRLFSEDNQLEPIQERETEPKDDLPKVSESANKTVHELSIIEEIEDADADESEKIIKDIDDVLANKDSSPKPKSAVPEKVSAKSIFSPATPKIKQGKITEGEKEKIESTEEAHADSPRKENEVEIAEKDCVELLEKDKATKDKRQSLKKKDEDIPDDKSVETSPDEASIIVARKSTEAKKFISDGSDDSFTLKLSLDKSLSKEDQSHDDEVFSSPGSNKENSSINIPPRSVTTKQRDSINKSQTNITPSPNINTKRTSFYESMDVDDDDEFLNIQDNSKQVTPTLEEPNKSQQTVQTEEEKVDIVEINSSSNSPEPKEPEDHASESFANLNSSQSDNLDSSSISNKSPDKSTLSDKNISRSNKTIDDKDDSSSDLSIKLVDSDEEISIVEEKNQSPPKVENVKRSKRPRLSDGTSKTILQRLQQNIDASNAKNQELACEEKSNLESLIEENISDNQKSSDESINVDEESGKSIDITSKTEKTTDKMEQNDELNEPNHGIDEVIPNAEKSQSEEVPEQNKKAVKSTSSEDDSIGNKSITEKNESEEQSKSQMEAVNPLKSKMHKMKDCGINFSNPSPAKPKVELDARTNSKLDEFLTKKLNALADDDDSSDENRDVKKQPSKVASSDESMSEDFEKNEFVDDMAEEFEEDSPSDGSNDIIDEGESINTTESESDSDESYDLDDSFIADDSETELLEGEEYDLEIDEDESNAKKTKRRRIIPKQDSTSEEDIEESITKKNRKSNKVKKTETPKGKSPKATPVRNSPKLVEKIDFIKSIPEKSSTPVTKTAIPSIRISETDETTENAKEKSVFEERIRSLVEPRLSTPNNSFSETGNTSKLNNSARSSSIIIQENISINDMQSDLIADKLQQVVKVFCAGIRSSEGNVSMNVSLDFTESAPASQENVVINVDDTENEGNSVNISQKLQGSPSKIENTSYRCKESPSLKKKQRSPSKLDKSFGESKEIETSTSQVGILDSSVKTHDLSVSKTKKKRKSSNKLDKSLDQDQSKVIEPSTEDLELSVKTHDSSGELQKSNKKRRSSQKLNKSVNDFEVMEPSISHDERLQLSQISVKKHDLSEEEPTLKKKRRSSHKFDKQLNESAAMETKSDGESGISQINAEIRDLPSTSRKMRRSNNFDNEIQEPTVNGSTNDEDLDNESTVSKKKKRTSFNKFEHQSISSGVTTERSPLKTAEIEQELNNSSSKQSASQSSSQNMEFDETNEEKDKTTTESEIDEKQALKKKKRNRKKKNTKTVSNEEEPKQQMTSKRLKLLEMACEELLPNDLRHKLPSNNEYSKTTDTKTNKIRLKRLQSKLDMKYARLGELITDVKNRPKRSIKPSYSVDNSGWIVEDDNVKPSVSNEVSAFNYNKVNGKDFKNQMLYDPRIRREPTVKLLKTKGYYP